MRAKIGRKRAIFEEMEKLVEQLGRQERAWRTGRGGLKGEELKVVSRLEEMHKEAEAKNG